MAFIATGNQEKLPIGFEIPFKGTAEYFDMGFKGYLYVCTNPSVLDQAHTDAIKYFIALINKR